MKIAILGYGVQGQSAGEYWHNKGADITICDQKTDINAPEWAKTKLGPDCLQGLDQYDAIVRSPLIHPAMIVAENSPEILDKVTTTTNEFIAVCPTKNIIGVTGTKGKGTTSTLITNMLQAAGITVHLGGNIGIDPLQLLKNDIKADDWVVLELANFQLMDLKQSPHIGVCVMVVPEHLDWHADMEEYIAAKQQLFINQGPADIAIYYADNENSISVADASEGIQIPYFEEPGALVVNEKIVIEGHEICDVSEIKLLGKHNWQNVCAAITAVWQVTQNAGAIRKVATTFAGLEYRLEFVSEINGTRYINDSFATTPEATIAAIKSFEQPKILILGGSDKGIDLQPVINEVVASNVRHVIAIGDMGPIIAKKLRQKGFKAITEDLTTMQDIVVAAQSFAQIGDVVLLSTACASFGLFINYKDRGNQFRQVVRSLDSAA